MSGPRGPRFSNYPPLCACARAPAFGSTNMVLTWTTWTTTLGDIEKMGSNHSEKMGNIGNNPSTTGIYALIDPRTHRVMYVGQSIDIDYRFRQHLNGWLHDSNTQKVLWISELRKLGLKPILKVLQECRFYECDEVETRWIRHFKVMGQCEFNKSPGGSTRRPSRRLNGHPDDWLQLGLKVKQADALLWEIRKDACALAGARGDTVIRKLSDALLKAKSALEDILLKTFPEWQELTRVFFGAEPPKSMPLAPLKGGKVRTPVTVAVINQSVPRGPMALMSQSA